MKIGKCEYCGEVHSEYVECYCPLAISQRAILKLDVGHDLELALLRLHEAIAAQSKKNSGETCIACGYQGHCIQVTDHPECHDGTYCEICNPYEKDRNVE